MTSPFETLIRRLPELEGKLDHQFKEKDLIIQAFIHRSFTNENPAAPVSNNERLEFLGDAVLGLMAADHVFRELPHTPEGDLTHLRAQMVEANSCSGYVQSLGVGEYVLLGKGEQRTEGRGRESIWADLFEAIVAAIYLDAGYEVVKKWFHRHFSEMIQKTLDSPMRNWKADLQDYSQKTTQSPPTYEIKNVSGPDHNKQYEVVVLIAKVEVGSGSGPSKKVAQQAAAEDAMKKIERAESDGQSEK